MSDHNPSSGFRVWEGIYDDFPVELPKRAFSADRWVDSLSVETQEALAALDADPIEAACSTVTLTHQYPLPVLVAIAASTNNKPVRILDFGGGLAASYPAVAGVLPHSATVEFHVVEIPAIVTRGQQLFAGRKNVHFHNELPTAGHFDIVHAAAALQYVADWQGLLTRFAELAPEWMAFGHLLAGPVRTFITRQNAYETQIPARFIAMDEFLKVISGLGYRLVYRALMIRTILGKEQPLPTGHFPEGYRLRYGCNLIFRRCGKSELGSQSP